jgi:hypothetical protein
MKALLLTILLLTQLLYCHCNAQVRVINKDHHQVYDDIFVIKEKDTINLTKFKAWESIVGYEVSPDGNYCFVRHKPNKKNTSYRLTLYNLKTLHKIKEIIPGFGGDFEWTMNSQIIHRWGCGTNCANVELYDLQLKEIFYTLSSGGFKYSPLKSFLVQFSMNGDSIWVYDLRSLKRNSIPKTFTTAIEGNYPWDGFQFFGESFITILSAGGLNVLKSINLNNVKWIDTDPKDTGEFYIR